MRSTSFDSETLPANGSAVPPADRMASTVPPQTLDGASDGGDGGPALGQPNGDGPADAARGSGHEGDLAGEIDFAAAGGGFGLGHRRGGSYEADGRIGTL